MIPFGFESFPSPRLTLIVSWTRKAVNTAEMRGNLPRNEAKVRNMDLNFDQQRGRNCASTIRSLNGSFRWRGQLISAADIPKSIARIANALQLHNCLSKNKDCHEFRFSIVRIAISVSNVTSLRDCHCHLKCGLKFGQYLLEFQPTNIDRTSNCCNSGSR